MAADGVAVAVDPPDLPGSARRHRAVISLAVLVALVAALALWTNHQAGNYYIYQPGTAPRLTASAGCRIDRAGDLRLATGTPCARLLVPADRAHALEGTILMVDVLVGKATAMQYALHELGLLGHFSRGSELIPSGAVLGTTPAAQLACQDSQQMAGAATVAPVVALQRLGYKVGVANLGARVQEVVPGSAAALAGIRCNDLIIAIDGQAVTTAPQAQAAIGQGHPGSSLAVTVRRTAGSKSTVITIRAALRGRPALDGQPAAPKVGFLGIQTATDTTYKLPFDVGVEVGDIGGPSAGLALTLGLLDVLSGGKLTGGHTVAVTGTILPDGQVGDVGGVAQKTVAVERAGAQLFLVPPQEYQAAESEADGRIKIEPVSSVTDALAALKAFGGQIPPPPG